MGGSEENASHGQPVRGPAGRGRPRPVAEAIPGGIQSLEGVSGRTGGGIQ